MGSWVGSCKLAGMGGGGGDGGLLGIIAAAAGSCYSASILADHCPALHPFNMHPGILTHTSVKVWTEALVR